MARYMLNDCANVEEAIKKTETGILVPEDWQDCHFFVSDADGRSVVIESRNSAIYNNEKRTVEVWSFQDCYRRRYHYI